VNVTSSLFGNLVLLSPELVIVGILVMLFLCDGFLPQTRTSYFPLVLTIIGCLFASFLTWRVNVAQTHFFNGLAANDGLSNFFRYFFFFATSVSLYIAYGSKELEKKSRMEFTLLLLCVTFGLSIMAISTNLLLLYIGIETVSIVSFVLAGFRRESLRSNEASFKYLVFGALASGLMVYGFSLLYGYAGSLNYNEIGRYLRAHNGEIPFIITAAWLMVFAGLAYKISAFPMHFWTPDVYEGSPTPVATFFSVGPKAAGFAALLRVLMEIFTVKIGDGQWAVVTSRPLIIILAFLSAATMLVGNLSAINQRSVKRMLAYSSIAHVGYLLMGLVTLSSAGIVAILFYLVVYCAMNLGAFWVVSVVHDRAGSDNIEAFSGMGWKSPVLGICMAIFLFSLTGIPVFAGFIGKFLLFGAVLQAPGFLWLAIFGVLNSVISLYYYVRVLKAMWLERPEEGFAPERLSLYHAVGLVGLAIPTVVLGLFFAPVLRFAEQTLAAFLG